MSKKGGSASPIFQRIVKGKVHSAYQNEIDLRTDYPHAKIVLVLSDAEEGDWVASKNGVLIQVIKKGKVGKTPYIRTIYGMFNTNANTGIPSEPNANIYSFTKSFVWNNSNKTKTTHAEEAFARLIAQAVPKDVAFMQCFGSKNMHYVKSRSTYLLRQKRIKKIVDKELKKVMDSIGLDEEFLMKNLYDIIVEADKYGDKKNAIEMACKLRGMFPKEKQSGTLALMQEVRGFTREEIEDFQKPSLEIPSDINTEVS
jgi:hypothetical protein